MSAAMNWPSRTPASNPPAAISTSSSKAGFARERNRAPASVRPTLRVVRMKSAAPTRASSARTAWLIADGVTPSSAAALRKLRCWATLRNASTPSSAPCLTVKFRFIARQHYREYSVGGSGHTSSVQTGVTRMSGPEMRDHQESGAMRDRTFSRREMLWRGARSLPARLSRNRLNQR